MELHGFGNAFKHAAGHGVGFAAANPNGKPRIHPLSTDEDPSLLLNSTGVQSRGGLSNQPKGSLADEANRKDSNSME